MKVYQSAHRARGLTLNAAAIVLLDDALRETED